MRLREGDIAKGAPVSARIGRLRFAEAAQDVINDYRANGKRSLDVLERRIQKHLTPFFGGLKMASITTPDVRRYVAERQGATEIVRRGFTRKRKDGTTLEIPEQRRASTGASNAEINRELETLKRIFVLAVQAGKLLHRPHIPMLREDNVRTGFFEPEQYASVRAHLPTELRPVIEFAYITGWRIASEVLPLEWRQVDLQGRRGAPRRGHDEERRGSRVPDDRRPRALLEAQHEARPRSRRPGRSSRGCSGAWSPTGAAARRPRAESCRFAQGVEGGVRRGRVPRSDPARPAADGRCGTWSVAAVPERVAMQLTGHKTRQFSRATTS